MKTPNTPATEGQPAVNMRGRCILLYAFKCMFKYIHHGHRGITDHNVNSR